MKRVIIELYACLTFALAPNRGNRELSDHFPIIADFIVETCDYAMNPTIVIIYFIQYYLKNCLYLLFDLGSFLSSDIESRENIQRILKSNQIQNMRASLNRFK